MAKHYDDIMVALLPQTAEWSTIDLPHLTLIYAGKIDAASTTTRAQMLKAAYEISEEFGVITLETVTRETFGEEGDQVDVLTLTSPNELLQMQAKVAMFNQSKHPFNPHVTVGPTGSLKEKNPTRITFDRVCVAWGSVMHIYKLKTTIEKESNGI